MNHSHLRLKIAHFFKINLALKLYTHNVMTYVHCQVCFYL